MQLLVVSSMFATAILGDVSHIFKPSHTFVAPSARAAPAGSVATATQHESKSPEIAIIRQSLENQKDGSYQWAYETANGIAAQEHASVREVESGHSLKSVQGSFQYTASDGIQYAVAYLADENGFQAQGEHLPTAPPVPTDINRALEYKAAHPEYKPKV